MGADQTAMCRATVRDQGRKPGTKCGGGILCRRSGGQKSPSGRGSGGRSPPEAEAILDFYMHNFDLIFYISVLHVLLAGG